MEPLTLVITAIYFTIGWILSDVLTNDDNREEVAMFTFLFWPVYIVVVVFMLVITILMLLSVIMAKLVNGFRGKGDDVDGTV